MVLRALYVWPLLATATLSQELFTGCGIESYYQTLEGDPIEWTRNDLQLLLETTHRNQLPYTSANEDVWDALMDLDAGSLPDTVKLIYSNAEVLAEPHGTSTTWNREHLWPKSRGVGTGGPDFTDIHHLRPSDANVNSARSNKYFGSCGTVQNVSSCVTPAHPEAAQDTSTDPDVFLPPAAVRGDVARAMFYMALRYDGTSGGSNLVLTDCPTQDNHLGYLSQLLEWHKADPADSDERSRNLRACERWQGNRNPFVDHQELAQSIFGLPQSIPDGAIGYSCPSNPVTPSPSPPQDAIGSCDGWSAGDVMVTTVNSDNPDLVALVALSDLSGGTDMFMTDNAWTGTSFRTNEGTVKLTIPSSGIEAGSVFGYGDLSLDYATDWQTVAEEFSLSTSGDTILLYCFTSNNDIVHIGGFSNSGEWRQPGLNPEAYGSRASALPAELALVGSVALAHLDNCNYRGQRIGTKEEIQALLARSDLWASSNTESFVPNTATFTIVSQSTVVSGSCNGLGAGDVMVIAVNSDYPDAVALVALSDLTEGTDLYMTDNAWTGTSFRTNEGTLKLTIPSGGIESGSVFGYGDVALDYESDWQKVAGSFALSTTGDTLLLYCKTPTNGIEHISGFSFSGEWAAPGMISIMYGRRKSALPDNLKLVGAAALEHRDNYKYTGRRTGSKEELLESLVSSGSWMGSSSVRFTLTNEATFYLTAPLQGVP